EKYIVPIMDARRGNAYSSVYQNNQEVVAEAHLDFAEFLKEEIFHDHKEKFVFTGQVENFKDIIISQGFTEEQIVSDGLDQLPSAYELGKKAINMEPVEVHSFAPNYLKKVEAEEKWLEKNEGKDKSADDYVKRI
ncbi:MAG: tRNA (adenosine(37)-N6)-threonylcarbamoyltransferase complex dimerization subunit type 1 TsaB, partial [Streptococcaceae bacterium]|nr:tRNA (adenosine(37)-N6)-threonylcarbamoyltransferase complex dimerization subunit type 1 TsaB [Streptococcaceae bacterium]